MKPEKTAVPPYAPTDSSVVNARMLILGMIMGARLEQMRTPRPARRGPPVVKKKSFSPVAFSEFAKKNTHRAKGIGQTWPSLRRTRSHRQRRPCRARRDQ